MKIIFHPMTLPRTYGHLLEQAVQTSRAHVAEDSTIDHRYSYVDVFLCYAGIYRFAYRTDWSPLWSLSLYRLIQSLEIFELSKDRTGDIVRLWNFISKRVSL